MARNFRQNLGRIHASLLYALVRARGLSCLYPDLLKPNTSDPLFLIHALLFTDQHPGFLRVGSQHRHDQRCGKEVFPPEWALVPETTRRASALKGLIPMPLLKPTTASLIRSSSQLTCSTKITTIPEDVQMPAGWRARSCNRRTISSTSHPHWNHFHQICIAVLRQ